MSEMPLTALINHRLVTAVQSWRWQEIPALLAQGGQANMLIGGETLLARVIANIGTDADEVLTALVQAGADVNGMDANGGSPLLAALCRDRPDLIEWLLKNGADVNLTAANKASPLWLAVEFDMADDTDMRTKILLAHGATPETKVTFAGRPPQSVREYLEQKAATQEVLSATGVVDMYELALAARRLLALLPKPQPPRDIHRLLRESAAGRNLKLAPRQPPKTKGPGG